MIFEIKNDLGRSLYCGPGAICLLTGTPASRVEQMLRRARNDWCRKYHGRRYYQDHKRRQFKGTYHSEIVVVLQRLGCKVEGLSQWSNTLQNFVFDTEFVPKTFLVSTSSHLVVVQRGKVYDNGSADPAAKYARSRVNRVWEVDAPLIPHKPTGVKIREPKPKDKGNIQEKRAAIIAAQVAGWEAKLKRAQTALKKLRPKLRRYQKLGVIE